MISAEDFLRAHPVQISSPGDSNQSNSSAESGKKSGRPPEATARSGSSFDVDSSSIPVDDGPVDPRQDKVESRGTPILGRVGLNNLPARKPRPGSFGSFRSRSSTVLREGADDEEVCREAALSLLDASARSSHALAQRLSAKGFAEETISLVIGRLTKVGLLDDRAYAQNLLQSCLRRNLGEGGVLKEMTRRGVDRSLAQEVVNRAHAEGLFVDSAYELGRIMARRTKGLGSQVYKRRLWSAGMRKGHDPSLIAQVATDLLNPDRKE